MFLSLRVLDCQNSNLTKVLAAFGVKLFCLGKVATVPPISQLPPVLICTVLSPGEAVGKTFTVFVLEGVGGGG